MRKTLSIPALWKPSGSWPIAVSYTHLDVYKRQVFYRNINDLLTGEKSPEEAAAAIDESCNAALEQGRASDEESGNKED